MNKFYLPFIITATFVVFFLAYSPMNTHEYSSRFKHKIVVVELENRGSTPQKKNEDISEHVLEYIEKRFRVELEDGIPVRQDIYGDLTKDDFLSKFVLQNNGKPFQTILFSTWRSGSTFTGDLLASVPNTLYYFEPLIYMPDSDIRIQGPPRSEDARKLLQALLTCNHHSSPIIEGLWRRSNLKFLPRLYSSKDVCSKNISLCQSTALTNLLCRMSPIHLIKLVRLHLKEAEQLFADTPNLKILYLVRDPRGTVNSRKYVNLKIEDQNNVSNLCGDLESEFYAAKHLIQTYPNQFKVVRYEDLTENVPLITKELLNFLGLEMHPQVLKFIETHTNNSSAQELRQPFSTVRNSSNTAVHWRNELPFTTVQEIQSVCASAMQLWGYKMATNSGELQNFTPYLKRDEYVVENVISS